ncbi:hypothetical protein D3C84_1167240 [compost metagenome]
MFPKPPQILCGSLLAIRKINAATKPAIKPCGEGACPVGLRSGPKTSQLGASDKPNCEADDLSAKQKNPLPVIQAADFCKGKQSVSTHNP